MTSPDVNIFHHIDKTFEIKLTLFRDRFARFKQDKSATLEIIANAILKNKAERKEELPLLKLATFGDLKSDKGSLRWDNNLISVSGVELDYDQEKIPFDDARLLLIEAGVACIIYTSPSHTEEKPRWRVLAPASEPMPPEARGILISRLNGVLHGCASAESFSLSQSYYYGYIGGREPPRVDVLDGTPINLLPELDAGAIGKSGKARANGAEGPRNFTDMEELIRRIVSGESLHPSVLSIAGKMAARGDHKETCIEIIGGAFEAAKADRYTDARWKEDVLRAIDYVWAKEEAKHAQPPPGEPAQADPDWRKRLHLTKKNAPMSNVHNVLLTLQNAEEFQSLLSFDQMLCSPMINRSPPAELAANDITDIQVKLQIAGLRSVGYEATKQAAVRHARNNSYHPVRDEFTQLAEQWDKEPRVDAWMITYLGCKDTPYHRGIGEFFLRQVVKRVFEPGCKADYMLILEGPQGLQKSKVIRILAGQEKYFSDNLPDLTDRKECSQHLRGLLLVEIPEMDTFTRADINTLKAFLSRTHERYRPPYEPTEITEPRQCSFVGTANKEAYLRDETGNRRYWGAKCVTIDIPRLATARNQIIGEAVTQYLAGAPTYPTPEWEREHAHPEQDTRFEDDPWTEPVTKFLAHRSRESLIKILTSGTCLNIPKAQIDPSKSRRVVAILRKLGWSPRRNDTRRWWVDKTVPDHDSDPPVDNDDTEPSNYYPDDFK